ncbi:MAG: hypothetical protein ACRYGC_00225, partial [Janthinobacterium lividum]
MDHSQVPDAAQPRGDGRPTRLSPRVPGRPGPHTIRSSILAAFLCMTLITAALGWFSFRAIRHAGGLVVETYDLSLQSISYARAAAVDFAGMQAALLRRGMQDDISDDAPGGGAAGGAHRGGDGSRAAELQRSLHEDLDIAASRARSPGAVKAAQATKEALGRCDVLRPAPAATTPAAAPFARAPDAAAPRTDPAAAARPPAWPPAPAPLPALAGEMDWQALDRCVQDVEGHIETLVEVTAGDGFLYRQKALRT